MALKLYFGPYEAHGVIRHKTQKLIGVVDELVTRGYNVQLIPTKRLNSLIIHYKDKEIYRCDIRYLMFNIQYEEDPVAQNVVTAVEEAKALFDAEHNPAFDIDKNIIITSCTQEHFCEKSSEPQTGYEHLLRPDPKTRNEEPQPSAKPPPKRLSFGTLAEDAESASLYEQTTKPINDEV